MRPDSPRDRKANIGALLAVTPPDNRHITGSARVALDADAALEEVRARCVSGLNGYFSSLMGDTQVRMSEVASLLTQTDGIADVDIFSLLLSVPLPRRREALISRMLSKAAIHNPSQLAQALSTIVGTRVAVNENVAKSTFELRVLGRTDKIDSLRSFVDGVKPAHLMYVVNQAQAWEHEAQIPGAAVSTGRITYFHSA